MVDRVTSNNATVGDLTEEMVQFQEARLPEPRLSSSYGWGPAFKNSLFVDGFTRRIGDNLMIGHLEDKESEVLSIEEVKERYDFDTKVPLKDSVASYMWARNEERRRNNAVLNYLDPNDFGSSAVPILGSIGGAFADPVSLLAFGLVGKGFQAASASTGFLTGGGIGKSLARESIVALGESAIEVPANYYLSQKLQEEYTVEDAAGDVGINLAFGNILGALGVGFGRPDPNNPKIARRNALDNHQGAEYRLTNDMAKAHAESGILPDYKAYKQYLGELNSQPRRGQNDYKYNKATPEVVNGTTFFASYNTSGQTKFNNMNFYGTKYGRGLMLTDNPNLANNTAASFLDQAEGTVVEFDISGKNLLDMDQPLPPNVKEKLRHVVKDLETLESGTGKEVLEELDQFAQAEGNSSIQEVFNSRIQEQGFDGYLMTESYGGNTKHNGVFLFDDKKAQPMGEFRAQALENQELQADARESTKKIVNDAFDERRQGDYDPEFDAIESADPVIQKGESKLVVERKSELDSSVSDLEELSGFGALTPEAKTKVDKLLKEVKEDISGDLSPESYRQLARAAEVCNRGQ